MLHKKNDEYINSVQNYVTLLKITLEKLLVMILKDGLIH